ncbi:MlaD family protein [Galbibacter pacificus]|uniref:MlaD family protein n=1 Tax=Galbibacter pacificus TaxID=2996052 RepID=A0ABT6FPA8_9FLAO|nr:MlaD family protein [Galbibacter pacificus]MDG3581626.1 MlaD family protein [Galbibacter pacificus]MDG3585104.1 MlaD family protein [Galbibacter pacificus]
MKLTKELKTGIIVVGGIVLFILGFTFLKGSDLFNSSRTYYAVYENVNGLSTGTSVSINGLQVGNIKDISFVNGEGNLLITFTVNSEFQFSKNSVAEIYDTGIIGGKSLRIVPVYDGSERSKSGDTLKTNVQPGLTELVTQKLGPLQSSLDGVLKNADSVMAGVDDILNEESRANIKSSLANLDKVIYNFSQASGTLNALLANNKDKLDRSLTNIDNLTTNLSMVSDTLAQANIGEAIGDLQSSMAKLDDIMAKIESGDGSVGKLLNDEELYKNLTDASLELELLLEDLRLNPKRYVHFSLFGKKPKPYEAPEEETNNE